MLRHILVIGYAGALDPRLKVGDLVAVGEGAGLQPGRNRARLGSRAGGANFHLTDSETLAESARSSGLNACTGDVITSPYVLGDPVHKRLLHEKFHAAIVDMETAALARVAASKAVPLSCVRVVSDERRILFWPPFHTIRRLASPRGQENWPAQGWPGSIGSGRQIPQWREEV